MRIHGRTLMGLAEMGLNTFLPRKEPFVGFARLPFFAERVHIPLYNKTLMNRCISFLPKQSLGLESKTWATGQRLFFPNNPQCLMSTASSDEETLMASRTEDFRKGMDTFNKEHLQNANKISDSLGDACQRYYSRVMQLDNLAKNTSPGSLRVDPVVASLARISGQIAATIEDLVKKKGTMPEQVVKLKSLDTMVFFLAERTEIEILGYKESDWHALRKAIIQGKNSASSSSSSD